MSKRPKTSHRELQPSPHQDSKPTKRPEIEARAQHSFALTASVYRHQLHAVVGDSKSILDTSLTHVLKMFEDFKPRDPVEEMLLSQMIQTHARLTYLTSVAHQQQNIKWGTMMHEAADRAANTFRRQMLALAEYRRPPRPARSFTAIGQANIANQQVVQNQEIPKDEKKTNEQGSEQQRPQPPALPADGGGPQVSSTLSSTPPPVEVEHRAEDAPRKECIENERTATR